MILTGLEITRLVKGGNLVIDPFSADQVNPNSYNVTLADRLRIYRLTRMPAWNGPRDLLDLGPKLLQHLDPTKDNPTDELEITAGGLVLQPGILYLASTVEYTETPYPYVPILDGRSSWGRLGLFVHVSAGYGDTGFRGKWTLELVPTHPVLVRPGVKIGQLRYHRVEGEALPYTGRYQDQAGPEACRLYLDQPPTSG